MQIHLNSDVKVTWIYHTGQFSFSEQPHMGLILAITIKKKGLGLVLTKRTMNVAGLANGVRKHIAIPFEIATCTSGAILDKNKL